MYYRFLTTVAINTLVYLSGTAVQGNGLQLPFLIDNRHA